MLTTVLESSLLNSEKYVTLVILYNVCWFIFHMLLYILILCKASFYKHCRGKFSRRYLFGVFFEINRTNAFEFHFSFKMTRIQTCCIRNNRSLFNAAWCKLFKYHIYLKWENVASACMYLRNAKYVYHYLLFTYKPDSTHRVLAHHYFSTKRINLKFWIVVLLMLLMRYKKVPSCCKIPRDLRPQTNFTTLIFIGSLVPNGLDTVWYLGSHQALAQ